LASTEIRQVASYQTSNYILLSKFEVAACHFSLVKTQLHSPDHMGTGREKGQVNLCPPHISGRKNNQNFHKKKEIYQKFELYPEYKRI
jgi:hypothetical protein